MGDFRLLKASPSACVLVLLASGNTFQEHSTWLLTLHAEYTVQKEQPSGAADLLEHYGLSGIYKLFTARGHDTYLKGLPADLGYRR